MTGHAWTDEQRKKFMATTKRRRMKAVIRSEEMKSVRLNSHPPEYIEHRGYLYKRHARVLGD